MSLDEVERGKRAIWSLTIRYSLLFAGVLAIFSLGLYHLADREFADHFVAVAQAQLGAGDDTRQQLILETAGVIAVDRFRIILLLADAVAVFFIPLGAYVIARSTVRPLLEANERQKQFVSNAAHELRTPLALMSAEFDVALQTARSPEDYRQSIIAGKQSAARMARLADQLLLLAKIEHHGILEVTDRLDLKNITKETVAARMADPVWHGRTIHYDLPRSAAIRGDATLIATALDNLVTNALKYSEAAQPVEISLRRSQANWNWAIANTPLSPIDQAEAQQLFDRFYQKKHEAGKQGFGLGLSLVRTIARVHNGRISADVDVAGRLTVTLSLPVA